MNIIAIKEMRNDERIWQKYYNDFTHHYLHLSATPDSLEHRLLQLTFTDTLRDFIEMKAIAAHCYLHLFQLDLAKIVALLKSLGQLHVPTLNEQMLYPKDSQKSALDNSRISRFVTGTLFAALVNAIRNKDGGFHSLQKWFNIYRDMVGLYHNAGIATFCYVRLAT